MYEASTNSFAISLACLVLILAASTPHILHAFSFRVSSKQKQKYRILPTRYEDEDGEATEESQAAFTDFPQRLLLICTGVIGCSLAIASAVLVTINAETADNSELVVQQWAQFASWVAQQLPLSIFNIN